MSLSGAAVYKKVGTQSAAEYANPHRLIQMLFDGAIEKMLIARNNMERGDIKAKGENINWAIRIIGGLQASLDKDKGGEVAATLSSLYIYIVEKLSEANVKNDVTKLDESIAIIKNIKEGWDGISEEADKVFNQPASESK
jgi:flagellar protein FliS